jgi:AcrR family transcriptional regulator
MEKPANSQWNEPKQSRSKVMVDAIFEAAARILPKIGSDKITTKKIAEVAGVSIGSLYQYFPNKESLLGALMDLGMNQMTAAMNKTIDGFNGNSTEDFIDSLVDEALSLMLSEKAKIREIYRPVSEFGRLPAIFEFRQRVVERIAKELERLHPGYPASEYIRVSFVGVHSLMGVCLTMLYDEKQTYSIDELAFELKTMLNGFFRERIKIPCPMKV